MAENEQVVLFINGASGDAALELELAMIFSRAFETFKMRHKKYGAGNIVQFGAQGVVVRSSDKVARLRQFYFNSKGGDVPDESVEDTWMDLSTYAAIGLLCHWGKWPNA